MEPNELVEIMKQLEELQKQNRYHSGQSVNR